AGCNNGSGTGDTSTSTSLDACVSGTTTVANQATTTAAASSSATFPSCDRIKQFQEQSLITCKDMTSLRLGGGGGAGTSSTSSSISWASAVDQLQLQAHATAGDHHIHATQEIAATTQLQPDHQAGCCIRFIDFLGVGA
ncbi:unnamed protein product, partial [Sphagnum troendelagicum]